MEDAYDLVVRKAVPEKPYPSWSGIKTILDSLFLKNCPAPDSSVDEKFIGDPDKSGFIDRLYRN